MNAPRSGCPINLTLEALGDRWSLIVIRDQVRAVAQRVEVVSRKDVRIRGLRSELLRTLTAASGVEAAVLGVRAFEPKWRAAQVCKKMCKVGCCRVRTPPAKSTPRTDSIASDDVQHSGLVRLLVATPE